MSYFGCDFEIEVRMMPTDNGLMALKCRGKLEEDGVDDIDIFVGTQENSAEVCASNLDIVE